MSNNYPSTKEHNAYGYFRTSFGIRTATPKGDCSCSYKQYYGTSAYDYVAPLGYEVLDGYGKVWLTTKNYSEAEEFKEMVNNLCNAAKRLERENDRLTSTINSELMKGEKERKVGKAVLEIIKASKEL